LDLNTIRPRFVRIARRFSWDLPSGINAGASTAVDTLSTVCRDPSHLLGSPLQTETRAVSFLAFASNATARLTLPKLSHPTVASPPSSPVAFSSPSAPFPPTLNSVPLRIYLNPCPTLSSRRGPIIPSLQKLQHFYTVRKSLIWREPSSARFSTVPAGDPCKHIPLSVLTASFVRFILGMLVVLFFKCMTALFNPIHHRGEGIKWGLASYTVIMFLLVTIYTGTTLHKLSVSYIDNRNFPDGPYGYHIRKTAKNLSQLIYLSRLTLAFLRSRAFF